MSKGDRIRVIGGGKFALGTITREPDASGHLTYRCDYNASERLAPVARVRVERKLIRDLFGNERLASVSNAKPIALDLFDAAAETAAMESGRPRSQERAELLFPVHHVR